VVGRTIRGIKPLHRAGHIGMQDRRFDQEYATASVCKDRSLYKCFKYLLMKLSHNINVFVIFKLSLTLAIFETISETTQEILEN